MRMHAPHDSSLGRSVAYPQAYAPDLLFAIPRAAARAAIGIRADALPFIGLDRWHCYELGWLDARGKPCVATATLELAADTPNLVESKSLKLYLNSLNAVRMADADSVFARIASDLSRCAGGPVTIHAGLSPMQADDFASIDAQQITVEDYGPPNADHLHVEAGATVAESLRSDLLKSNCPVTGQPDWASVRIHYRGARIERAGLLRYLVSYRDHCGFHEQCVEQVFVDLMARCQPQSLSVEARYTRRGGLDINPWRATPDAQVPAPGRDPRQ